MQVNEIMTPYCEFVPSDATIQEAARKMQELDCGFIPIGDKAKGKLEGVVTDRDITIRAVAQGTDPTKTPVKDVESRGVFYCYESDDIQSAANSMHDQQIYRLVVLDNPNDKQLRGVVTLGDILRHKEKNLAAEAASGVAAKTH